MMRCSTRCYKREWKKKNPVRYAYQTLKDNAKRRGKAFELTLEQFEQFAVKTMYMAGKGRSAESLHIDRINPWEGYTVDNIRVLTNRENVQRHRSFLKYETDYRGVPVSFTVKTIDMNQPPEADLPF